ncbi:MAG: vgr related protein [Pseudomonadota bacterium]
MPACPVGGERHLTCGEIEVARSVFGSAIQYARVKIKRRKWWPLQPRKITMAPQGDIHFHPRGTAYCDDFSQENLARQGFFIHEMTHVWQTQSRGRWYLVLNRHPFCRYDYALRPGQNLESYGIEQQAEIVRHAFLLRNGVSVVGIGDPKAYNQLVRFEGATL